MLIDRYADGRSPCNCHQAWYAPIGEKMITADGKTVVNDNPRCCKYGCQSNQLSAKEEIGRRVADELGLAAEGRFVPYGG